METLIQVLQNIDDEIAWEEEKKLIDDRILDSIMLISIIADLEEAFGISIRAEEIRPENFNSVEAMWDMICRIRENYRLREN